RGGPPLWGFDRDPRAVRATLINTGRAGVPCHVERRELADARPPTDVPPGLVMTNPPYGERLGEASEVEALYPRLGDWLKQHCQDWRAAVFTANPELGRRMGLKALRTNVFYNGPLEARLLQFEIRPAAFVDREQLERRARERRLEEAWREGEPFVNRLRKNLRALGRWAQREGISCYRLYDADIPEFAVAVDLYHQWVHVQEYRAPPSVDPELAARRLEWIMALLPRVLEVPQENLFLKIRRRRGEREQYRKQAESGEFHQVREGDVRLWVNFQDYLDTGLFLDHRPIRRWFKEQAGGRRFLNLFGYTGTATVQAALGGAVATTTVDLSRTYLDWARRNLQLNGLSGARHRLIQADCREWLARTREHYELIFLDPPSHSVSKRMAGDLDIQRDHPALIREAVRLLVPDGLLVFSTNLRGFQLNHPALDGLVVGDITPRTIPRDFQRRPDIHRCFEIRRHSG
ncbi:MAG: bifunctional 23S rRNA (guanine(2069)-N(7))-methyltransferase RlmK/23S rRNA (guanine(2445)-N(2))-methyltransferase RlmL, partial [Candidatus Competibacteraceae bacterium]|nr:bifunctional 23S rRNA (guanine(2069)-N(7))-methyltransferase RlmK/23S rRNA (guanine(2445)-N(2))-methyltransferase RlmL [Candidatus Competibacteraceae bacterium]